jgi:hypothetical protein
MYPRGPLKPLQVLVVLFLVIVRTMVDRYLLPVLPPADPLVVRLGPVLLCIPLLAVKAATKS